MTRYLCVLFPHLEEPLGGRVDLEARRNRVRIFTSLLPVLRQQVLDLWSPVCGVGLANLRRLRHLAQTEAAVLVYLREQWQQSIREPFRLGVAEGALAALLAADTQKISEAKSAPAFLSDFPVGQVLRLFPPESDAPKVVETLRRLGVEQIAQIAAWPASKMRNRFGEVGGQIDCLIRGGEPTWRLPAGPAFELQTELALEPPAEEAERCLFALKRLAEDLLAQADKAGQEIKRLCFRLETEDGGTPQKEFTLPDFAVVEDITRRCRWQLQNWFQTGQEITAAVAKIGLEATLQVPAKGLGRPLWGRPDSEGGAWQLADRAGQILGEESVFGVSLQGGFDPRSQVQLFPFHAPPLRLVPTEGQWEGRLSGEAPQIVFESPQAVTLLGQDSTVEINERDCLLGVPKTLKWDGKTRRVETWSGPWRVLDNWWNAAAGVRRPRHYLKISAQGLKLLLVTVNYGKSWWADAQWLDSGGEATCFAPDIT